MFLILCMQFRRPLPKTQYICSTSGSIPPWMALPDKTGISTTSAIWVIEKCWPLLTLWNWVSTVIKCAWGLHYILFNHDLFQGWLAISSMASLPCTDFISCSKAETNLLHQMRLWLHQGGRYWIHPRPLLVMNKPKEMPRQRLAWGCAGSNNRNWNLGRSLE